MAEQCKELVGRGSIQYACRLTTSHEGPHVAPEDGPSQIARGRWEAEQKAKTVAAPILQDLFQEPTGRDEGEYGPYAYSPTVDFRMYAMDVLNEKFEELPAALRSWVLGAQAQMILRDMWKASEVTGLITIDRATLERVVPEQLRSS